MIEKQALVLKSQQQTESSTSKHRLLSKELTVKLRRTFS